jgi:hypothetical protein
MDRMSRHSLTSTKVTPNSTDLTSRAARKPVAARSRELLKRRISRDLKMTLVDS